MAEKPLGEYVTVTVPGVVVESVGRAPSTTDLLVEAWYVETFHNLALPTEMQNRFRAAADELKARLRQKEQ